VLVPANYNCPGQLVVSGSLKGVELGCEKLKAAGARRQVFGSQPSTGKRFSLLNGSFVANLFFNLQFNL
jgi:malonyl CoA-acyl carrier protein transacylase